MPAPRRSTCVTRPPAVGVADAVAADGGLDLWVNNAGVLFSGPAWEQGSELRQTMLDVNASGLINGSLAALAPMMAAGRGHIVNVVSLAGIVAAPGEVVYSASKHAAMAFTLGTLFDLRRNGYRDVRLSAVCPDGIWTPMLEDKLDDPEAAGSFSGHLLTPERVAREVGKLTERPRPVLIIPRWRGPQLRFFDAFPRLGLRLVPLVMWDARRSQRRYKRRSSRQWPRSELRPPEACSSLSRRPAQTFLKTPTTLPSTRASVVMIGSISSFSGCSRMWSFSRK